MLLQVSIHPSYCVVSAAQGEREVVMDQHFFTGYRRNIVRPEEVLLTVHVPYTQQVHMFPKVQMCSVSYIQQLHCSLYSTGPRTHT